MQILVVDDELDVQSLFEQRFRREIRSQALELRFALSGGQALAYLEAHPGEVGVVLSDINMPGMSGLELLRCIRSRYAGPPPVLMVTAYGDSENYHLAMAWGARDFLTKPLDFAQLKAKLSDISEQPQEGAQESPG